MAQHQFSWSILISVLIANSDIGNAEIVTKPRNVAIQVGSSAYFNCSSSLAKEIHWFHYAVGSEEKAFVYGYGKFYAPYEGNFVMEKNETTYNLIIPSVRFQDAGEYVCQDNEGIGEKASAQLTVWGHEPICNSDKRIDYIIGPNSCGIEAEDLVLTCSIQYSGDEEPKLEWRNLATNDVISKGTIAGKKDNHVTLNLTLKGDTSIDGNSYLCQTSDSTFSSYSCNIGPVIVFGKSDTYYTSFVIAITFAVIFSTGLIICGIVIANFTFFNEKNESHNRSGAPVAANAH